MNVTVENIVCARFARIVRFSSIGWKASRLRKLSIQLQETE